MKLYRIYDKSDNTFYAGGKTGWTKEGKFFKSGNLNRLSQLQYNENIEVIEYDTVEVSRVSGTKILKDREAKEKKERKLAEERYRKERKAELKAKMADIQKELKAL